MPSSLLIPFEGHRTERDLISKMLLTYGELEHLTIDMLGAVMRSKTQALRTMYQLRSETNRLLVFEAIAAPAFEEIKLGGQLKEGMDALNHCKAIRNQYAHCTWAKGRDQVLRFANLEKTAQSKGPQALVVVHPLSEALVRRQWAYFEYTDNFLLWLRQEYRRKRKLPADGPKVLLKPQRLHPPKLNSHGEEPSSLWMSVGRRRLQGELPLFRL